jgi:hypothetical protein
MMPTDLSEKQVFSLALMNDPVAGSKPDKNAAKANRTDHSLKVAKG